MSKDIRSFFSVLPKKTKAAAISKKPVIISDSEDDDVIPRTPVKEATKSKAQKLKPVSIDEVFGNKPVRQSDVPPVKPRKEERKEEKRKSRRKKKSEAEVHEDEDFAKTLKDLDETDDVIFENIDILDKTFEDAKKMGEVGKKEKKKGGNDKIAQEKKRDAQQPASSKPKPESSNGKTNPEIDVHEDEDFKKTLIQLDIEDDDTVDYTDISDVSIRNVAKRRGEASKGSTPKKKKLEHSDSGIDPDQEAFEKKRYSAMLYERYKNRGGPKHHGEKELPQGKPNCLENLTFLRTGVLDSLESDEFELLIKNHGGRVVQAVSRKVNYLVVGDEPGPAKLAKSRSYNIPEIDEDELLDMILTRSGMKPRFVKHDSVESGISVSSKRRMSSSESDEEAKPKQKKSKDEEAKAGARLKDKITKNKKESTKIDCKAGGDEDRKSPSDQEKGSKIDVEGIGKAMKVDRGIESFTSGSKMSSETKPKASNERPKAETSTSQPIKRAESSSELYEIWTEKYKPKELKYILGQQDTSSNMRKLLKWLSNWQQNQNPEKRKKIQKPSPWAKNDDGAYFKAALLSGPPGVGKTTTATLVSKELGLDVVEFNASDTRSKKLLHEEVSQLLSTTSLAGFAMGEKNTSKKRILLMDEVDGMAGNEDRGGINELINLIKNTNIPIICMCNDRNHQKMRSLVNYCFDLRFNPPKLEQIKGAMLSICYKEKIDISPKALTEIITGSGCDVRQTLNHLSMWAASGEDPTAGGASGESRTSRKDTTMGPWEVVRKVFSESERKSMSLADRARLFFFDYSLGPLFVQENYVNVRPKCPKNESLKRLALAADSISRGDLIDSKIRSSNNWSLLETQAFFSSVLPGHYMSGEFTSRINFPGWLGKNSTANKRKRMLIELYSHTRTSTSGGMLAMTLDYRVPLRDAIVSPLKKFGMEGVRPAIEVMKSYNLLREDLDYLVELCQWKNAKNPFANVDPKVKAAFTRAYNKEGGLPSFASTARIAKKKFSKQDPFDDEEDSEEEEENDDLAVDSMIKVAAKRDKKDAKEKKPKKASASKRGGKGKK